MLVRGYGRRESTAGVLTPDPELHEGTGASAPGRAGMCTGPASIGHLGVNTPHLLSAPHPDLAPHNRAADMRTPAWVTPLQTPPPHSRVPHGPNSLTWPFSNTVPSRATRAPTLLQAQALNWTKDVTDPAPAPQLRMGQCALTRRVSDSWRDGGRGWRPSVAWARAGWVSEGSSVARPAWLGG